MAAGDFKQELKSILDGFEKKMEAEARGRQQTLDDRASFAKEFERVARSIMRPVLEQFVAALREKGHLAEIDVGVDNAMTFGVIRKDRWNSQQRVHMDRMSQLQFRPHDSSVSVTLTGANIQGQVAISGGPRGEYPLSGVTTEVIEREVMKLISEIFET